MVKKSGHTLLQTVTFPLAIALWLVFRHAIVHTPSRDEPPWQGGEGDELDKAVDIYHGLRGPGTDRGEHSQAPWDSTSPGTQENHDVEGVYPHAHGCTRGHGLLHR